MSHAKEPTLCRACREEIRPGARKCIHCQSAQGWQRHLSLSSTVLALLIALISVLQSALPVFIAIYKGDASRVSMHFLKANGLSLILAASNSGTRPGTLAHGTLTLPLRGDSIDFSLNGDSAVDLILPAQTTPIKLTFDDGSVDQLRQEVENFHRAPPKLPGATVLVVYPPVRATLSVEVIQFDNSRTKFRWPVFVQCGGKSCNLLEKEPAPLGAKSSSPVGETKPPDSRGSR
jgi:hypothetical protein